MSKPLRLLVVEDSEAEVAPLVRELRRHGYEPEAVHVDTADAMRDALQRQAWGVVIANHASPRFSSQHALRVLQESGLDLPFIIVSETNGEEAAVTAMKAGAHDYVMKDHLTRLGPAVERELQEASLRRQRREAEQSLAAQQAVTRILAEADTLGEAGAKILQAIAKNGEWEAGEIWTVDHQSDVLRCLEIWHTASKPLGEFETRTRAMTFARGVGLPGRVWASGQPAWIADVTRDANFPRAPLATEAGLRGAIGFPIGLPMVVGREVMGVIAFFRTAPGQPDEKLLALLNAVGNQIGQFLVRQRAEEELKKLSSAVKQTANCVLITDRKGVIEYVNPAFERTTGYAREEVIGKTPRLLKSGKHDQKYYEALWNTVLAGRSFSAEFVNRKKSGELYHTEQSITPIQDSHGHITHFVSTGRDTSERSRSEEALKLFRALVDQSNDTIEVLDPETGRFLDVNEKGCLDLGYSREEYLALSVFDVDPTVDPSSFPGAVEELRKSGVLMWEGSHRRKDGSTFPVEVNLKYVRLDRDYIVTVVRNITERQQAAESLRASEERFRDLFENAHDLIQSVRPDGTFLYVNRAWRETLGYSEAEIPGLSMMRDIVHPSSVPHCTELFQRLIAGDSLDHVEAVFRAKDGREILLEGSCNCHFVNGQPDYTRQIFRDSTARKQAEEALRASEARYRTLAETAQDIIYIISREFRVEYVNEYGAKQFGRPVQEMAGRLLTELFPAETTQWQLPDMAGIFRTGEPLHRERQLPGGPRLMWLDTRLVPIKNATGEVESILGISRDITERKRVEAALRESEDRYRSLVEGSPDAIGIYQEDKLVFINATGARQLGAKTKEELLGREGTQIIHPDDLPAASDRLRRRLAGETGMYPAEVRYRRLDGTTLPVEVIATPINFGGKAAVQFIARDITERRQAEQQLRDSAALYHSLVEHLPQHVFRKDRAGRFTFGNGHFCQSLGKPLADILGQTDLDLFPAPLAAKYRQDDQRVVQTGQTFEGEEEHPQASGKVIIVHVVKTPLRAAAGQIIGVQGIAWDITEKKQLEAQFLRTQRLESIGTLASGVAHDLNNALAPIMMATELLRLEFPDTATSYLDLIQGGAQRGADMVKQLLTFAKGVEGERLLIQPQHLLKEMENLMRSTFPKNIHLQTWYAKNLQTILGDATQLHQVLLNLCVNARDAMPEGGTLTLEAENREINTVYARAVPGAKPGHYVVWRVTDTGIGMPPEILERIFEPFFSTKGPDKGTGLGLSTLIGIVKSHGGFVQVHSTPGQGSTFAVCLPAYNSGISDTSLLTKPDTTFRGHGQTILVVDDEASVRNPLRALLTKLNFKVLTASDGTAALVQVAENQAELRAVITDLHMPHMDGLSFVRVLKGRSPQAGIIVASGRLDEREADEFKKLGVSALLEKPFTQVQLVEALKMLFQK